MLYLPHVQSIWFCFLNLGEIYPNLFDVFCSDKIYNCGEKELIPWWWKSWDSALSLLMARASVSGLGTKILVCLRNTKQ